jgi:hypothetical protein
MADRGTPIDPSYTPFKNSGIYGRAEYAHTDVLAQAEQASRLRRGQTQSRHLVVLRCDSSQEDLTRSDVCALGRPRAH